MRRDPYAVKIVFSGNKDRLHILYGISVQFFYSFVFFVSFVPL
jgi:hypothetical protein